MVGDRGDDAEAAAALGMAFLPATERMWTTDFFLG